MCTDRQLFADASRWIRFFPLPYLFLSQSQESLTLYAVQLISLLFSSNIVYSDSKYTAVRSLVSNSVEGGTLQHAFGSRKFIAVCTKAEIGNHSVLTFPLPSSDLLQLWQPALHGGFWVENWRVVVRILHGHEIFLLSYLFRRALGPIQPVIQWVQETRQSGIKR